MKSLMEIKGSSDPQCVSILSYFLIALDSRIFEILTARENF